MVRTGAFGALGKGSIPFTPANLLLGGVDGGTSVSETEGIRWFKSSPSSHFIGSYRNSRDYRTQRKGSDKIGDDHPKR